MKKTFWLFILLLFIPFMVNGLFEKKLPIPMPDIITVKLKNLTFFDLIAKDLDMIQWNQAELTDSKPEDLVVDVDYEQMNEVKFGCFKLGNNERKTWFLVGKDDNGYWSEFYIDQNLDNRIGKKEKVKGFQTGQDSIHHIQRMQALSMVPVPLKVSYKGLTAEYEKTLYFFITTGAYLKKDLSDTIVGAVSASFLEGEFSISDKEDTKPVKFRIIDINGNGCFNDYGTDYLFMDLNNDGYFRKKEGSKLTEYLDSSDKQHLRIIVIPFPAKIAVAEVTEEYDLATLEPITGKDNTTPQVSPEPTEEPHAPAVSK